MSSGAALGFVIGVVALGGMAAAVSMGMGGGGSSPATPSGQRPGYVIKPGCTGFEVTNEAAALAYARAEGAAASSATWPQRIILRLFGSTCANLQPLQALEVFKSQAGFIWRLFRAALQGGVAGGRFTAEQAQQALDALRSEGTARGIDPLALVPETIED